MSISKEIIKTENACPPLGPYSQAVKVGRTLYVSSLIGVDKATMKLVEGGAIPEAKMIFENLDAILKAAGGSFENVVRVTFMIKDLKNKTDVNVNVYEKYFPTNQPARTIFQVPRLPLNAEVAFEATAVI